jgi:hypothetical protein
MEQKDIQTLSAAIDEITAQSLKSLKATDMAAAIDRILAERGPETKKRPSYLKLVKSEKGK